MRLIDLFCELEDMFDNIFNEIVWGFDFFLDFGWVIIYYMGLYNFVYVLLRFLKDFIGKSVMENL